MPTSKVLSTTNQPQQVGNVDSIGSRVRLDAITLTLFTTAIFTSATLLFVVQPMVGKILLPKLGGAPAVWNTCMVFFQAALLAGYLSAHLLTKYVSLKYQVVIFAGALLLAMQSLPISVGPEWVDELLSGREPSLWLLSVLFFRVAPVFFVLSTTSPLMQKWFAKSGHPDAHDPYFLYAASNVGSILALLAYPLIVEVNLGVTEQTTHWMCGFGFFTVLATCCGIASWYGGHRKAASAERESMQRASNAEALADRPLSWSRRGYWVLLSFIPSSLMLGVTTYISTDVSSIPLIWVIPLAMYLLTFVFAFSNRQFVSAYWMGRVASLLTLVIIVTVVTGANDPPIVIVPMHLMMFFAVAMFCHQKLASDRPSANHLTDFYLWLSVGGVIGGLFNAILAPSLFVTIIEYPLVMVLASFLRETQDDGEGKQSHSPAYVRLLGFGGLIFAMTLATRWCIDVAPAGWITSLANLLPLAESQIKTLLAFGPPAVLVLHNMERRAYFTLGLSSILLVSIWNQYTDKTMLERDRNFYGTVATAREKLSGGTVVKMFHGNTVHGWQWTDESRRRIPLTYYGQSSGVGKLIASRQPASGQPLRIGAVGLGAGTLAATMRLGDSMCYYEINPQVVDHAEQHFTYLSDARDAGADIEIRLGDARLVLESEMREGHAGNYDVMVVDAFSSDSIPAHLLTNECMKSYLDHVAEDGVIAFHITNRFLDLEPVLAKLCQENQLAGFSYHFRDIAGGDAFDETTGETASSWVLISRDASNLKGLHSEKHMRPLEGADQGRLWTDDYSNVISAFNARL